MRQSRHEDEMIREISIESHIEIIVVAEVAVIVENEVIVGVVDHDTDNEKFVYLYISLANLTENLYEI